MNIYSNLARARRVVGRLLRAQSPKAPGLWAGYTRDAMYLVNAFDCTEEDLVSSQSIGDKFLNDITSRSCNWYLPAFTNPFYGGLYTIFRLAAFLKMRYGIQQRFVICGQADVDHIRTLVSKAQIQLTDSDILILTDHHNLTSIPSSEYSICTLWTTAYVLLKVKNTARKFYMIQDFEPGFYPNGTTQAQAELTYSFGFHGICNTEPILAMYQTYGGTGITLVPSVDHRVFYSVPRKPQSPVKRIFLYARPGTPRNAFELAISSLRIAKQRLGSKIEVLCAGEDWNADAFGVGTFVKNLGTLSIAETAALYQTCDIGIALMMTKHPSYLPIELMASGALVISNINTYTSWFMKHNKNCLLSLPSQSCLANTICFAVEHFDDLSNIRSSALESISTQLQTWDHNIQIVCEYILSV